MKRIVLLITLTLGLLASIPAMAQFRYGPSVSANFNSLKFKQDLINVDKGAGFSAGIHGEMMFPGIGFGLDLGLRYEQRGATLNLGERLIWSSQGYGKERVYLHDLDIPIHLKFKWTRLEGLENYIAPFVYGGPTFSILMAHSSLDAFKFSGGTLGITAGLGFELLTRWQISGSYTWGMTYALKANQLTNFSARPNTWDIRLTYLF